MTPYYADALVTIYHGRAEDVLPTLGTFDAVIADPPYGVGFDYGTDHDDAEAGYIEWLWPIIEEAERHVSPGGWMVVYQAARHVRMWPGWFPRDWRLVALPKMFVQMRAGVVPLYATDYALVWRLPGGEKAQYEPWMPKGNRDWFLSRTPNFGLGRRSIKHPCPRPLDAVQYLVSLFVPPDGAVLDPFVGSGTTLVAAKSLGRAATGIEVAAEFCDESATRCAQEVLGLVG